LNRFCFVLLDEHTLQRYYISADEQFFVFCDKELVKINSFFAEKLAEAQRKFENLKNELSNQGPIGSGHHTKRNKNKRTLAVEIDEDDQDDNDEMPYGDNTKNLDVETFIRQRGISSGEIEANINSNHNDDDDQVISSSLTKKLLNKNKKRQAKQKQYRKQEDLKLAYSEFYLSLILLQNYQTLNFTGFKKILKKHDKIFKTERGNEWHKAQVETSLFHTTKKVTTLIIEVENLFTQYFEKGDRQRAMKRLRVPPFEEKQNPWTTFRLGLFLGMIFILLPALIVSSFLTYHHDRKLNFDWKTAIKLYRSPMLIIFHLFLIGINSYGWSRAGVNHVLIFEIDPRNHLTYQQFLEVGTFLGIFWFISLLAFILSAYEGIEFFIHPLALVAFFVIYLLNPIKNFHYSSRIWLTNNLWQILSSPFYHVGFSHFWLADQLTSYSFVFNDIEFFSCWFMFDAQWAPFKNLVPLNQCRPDSSRDLSKAFNIFALLMSCLPFWFRFMQCLRRYRDTLNAFPHLANACKYATQFLSVGSQALFYYFAHKALYSHDVENPFFYFWIICQLIGTIFKLIWDFKMDWGFFDKNAGENKFLREAIVYSSKSFYYFAIVNNLVLRFTWIISLYSIDMKGESYSDIVATVLGFLELFRLVFVELLPGFIKFLFKMFFFLMF
jgi:xenotropic and polytropic retrovirus receptor 1